ncbi:MAG: prepilin-type N-terminal cleavage/methylation domain-containing protein [Phycisphaerae bacterium]|nr:prepilin-type N-terminal cleavage/methylation domain-containing protein [Phycisphaerae bacterium]
MLRHNRKLLFFSGLTLLEMVIAMAIMVIVFSAVFPQFVTFQSSWASKQSNSQTIQNGNVFSDQLSRFLAKAVKVTAVSNIADTDGFVEFEDNDGVNFRCDIGLDNYIEFGPVGSLSDLAGPVSSLQFSCYDACDLDTPLSDVNNVDSIRFITAQAVFTNSNSVENSRTLKISSYLRTNGNNGAGSNSNLTSRFVLTDKLDMWGNQAVVDSYHSSAGQYGGSNISSEAVVTINSTSNNKIILSSGADIKGDVYIGPDGDVDRVISQDSGSEITGTIGVLEQEISIPGITAPTGSPFNGNPPNLVLSGNQDITVDSDKYYKTLSLNDNSVLKISGDITILVKNHFEVYNNAKLEIMPSSSLKLFVTKHCYIENKVNANTADPSKLEIYFLGNNKMLDIFGDGEVHAVVQNPNGKVCVYDQQPFYGSLIAEQLEGNGKVHIDLDLPGISGSAAGVSQILP